jgi:hypothetical protein
VLFTGTRRWDDDQQREEVDMASNTGAAGGGVLYGLGIFGAWFYFFQHAHTFWEFILAFFQGVFWPAWMVYEVFLALKA